MTQLWQEAPTKMTVATFSTWDPVKQAASGKYQAYIGLNKTSQTKAVSGKEGF